MRLLVTPGMGIGPEVTLRALQAAPELAGGCVLIGRWGPLVAASWVGGPNLIQVADLKAAAQVQGGFPVIVPADDPEPVEVAAIRLATAACLAGQADALVTGPIHKARLAARGFAYRGHTDFLGALCGGAEPVMAFAGGDLRVALVTVHIPLAEVPRAITRAGVAHTARTAGRALVTDLGLAAPRIAVCGLNPHAGEDGLLGGEEIAVIGPACADLRAEGWTILGPVSAETAFLEARAGRVDLVVAMYHDQGLAPLKAVDFGRSVNWTLGLPLVRTSVDHGTADALVGTGKADPASMVAALRMAAEIVARRAISDQRSARPIGLIADR